MTAPAKNTKSFTDFLQQVSWARRHVGVTDPMPYLVLDNNSVHRSEAVRRELSCFHAVFLPRYSSELNCQNAVFKELRREVFARLSQRCRGFVDDFEFQAMIQGMCNSFSVSFDVTGVLRANFLYRLQYLRVDGDDASSDSDLD